jgi:hypothetical protein
LLLGFELCARLLPRDAGFAGPGTSFLEKLLVDPAGSAARCTVFSALALITTVHVRAAAKAADAPLYWTRLAALAHAGVLTDALRGMPDSEGFLQWASENFLPAYIWHGVIDRRDAPRWNPDWISPDHLYAELVGRAQGALEMVPAAERPGQWTSAMDTAFVRLKEEGRILAAFFPGPFDDFRAPVPSTANKAFAEIEERLDAAARLSDVAGLFALANSVQLTSRAVVNVQRLLELPVTEPIAAGQPEMPFLRICAHIAAASRSETIGQALINRCLFKARNQGSGDAVTDLFEVIAEACGAWGDPQRHREVLGRSATNLCFAVDAAEDLSHLIAIFDVLAKRDERLMPVLARPRAIARAKLGRS